MELGALKSNWQRKSKPNWGIASICLAELKNEVDHTYLCDSCFLVPNGSVYWTSSGPFHPWIEDVQMGDRKLGFLVCTGNCHDYPACGKRVLLCPERKNVELDLVSWRDCGKKIEMDVFYQKEELCMKLIRCSSILFHSLERNRKISFKLSLSWFRRQGMWATWMPETCSRLQSVSVSLPCFLYLLWKSRPSLEGGSRTCIEPLLGKTCLGRSPSILDWDVSSKSIFILLKHWDLEIDYYSL